MFRQTNSHRFSTEGALGEAALANELVKSTAARMLERLTLITV
jgi:hypothetical protein